MFRENIGGGGGLSWYLVIAYGTVRNLKSIGLILVHQVFGSVD